MKQLIHTESLTTIQNLKGEATAFVLTEPFFSYHHPHTQSSQAYLNLVQACAPSPWYMEINGYLEDHQLDALKTWIVECLTHHPKGIYFSDFAVYELLNELNYSGEKIYAPETILTNEMDVDFYLNHVDRVVLAKELTLEEIIDISNQFPHRIEVMACGHPLMSVSKRPLVQNYLDEIKDTSHILNDTHLRMKEQKRPEWMPILEEKLATSIYAAELLWANEEYQRLADAQVYGVHCDNLFIEDEDYKDLVNSISKALTPEELKKLQARLPLGKAYFYRKTNLTKEEKSA